MFIHGDVVKAEVVVPQYDIAVALKSSTGTASDFLSSLVLLLVSVVIFFILSLSVSIWFFCILILLILITPPHLPHHVPVLDPDNMNQTVSFVSLKVDHISNKTIQGRYSSAYAFAVRPILDQRVIVKILYLSFQYWVFGSTVPLVLAVVVDVVVFVDFFPCGSWNLEWSGKRNSDNPSSSPLMVSYNKCIRCLQ